jgi:hypothetical protein
MWFVGSPTDGRTCAGPRGLLRLRWPYDLSSDLSCHYSSCRLSLYSAEHTLYYVHTFEACSYLFVVYSWKTVNMSQTCDRWHPSSYRTGQTLWCQEPDCRVWSRARHQEGLTDWPLVATWLAFIVIRSVKNGKEAKAQCSRSAVGAGRQMYAGPCHCGDGRTDPSQHTDFTLMTFFSILHVFTSVP